MQTNDEPFYLHCQILREFSQEPKGSRNPWPPAPRPEPPEPAKPAQPAPRPATHTPRRTQAQTLSMLIQDEEGPWPEPAATTPKPRTKRPGPPPFDTPSKMTAAEARRCRELSRLPGPCHEVDF